MVVVMVVVVNCRGRAGIGGKGAGFGVIWAEFGDICCGVWRDMGRPCI